MATTKNAAMQETRTKRAVRLAKTADADALTLAKVFVPESKLRAMPEDARNEIIKIASGIKDIVRHGKFDLRQHMR